MRDIVQIFPYSDINTVIRLYATYFLRNRV